MKYETVVPARFLRRINRFVAHVELDGNQTVVHVKNTGRCKELLTEGCTVYLACSDNENRKTAYDLVAVEKQREGKAPLLVNMDSQIVNGVAEEWLKAGHLFSKNAIIRREVTYGNSRFDFYIEDGERTAFLEVKGVTLERDGIASFPDAPTERGVKHLKELIRCKEEGHEAYVLFVVAMKEMRYLHPNDETHKAFGDALREADAAGVQVLAVDCIITPDSVTASEILPVILTLEE